jgi:eukaryotic translation initiation factor 2C
LLSVWKFTNRTHRNPGAQDPKIAKIEDAMHPATKKTLDLSSLKLSEGLPIRPGYGTRGAKVELTANYIELLPPSNMTLHRYDIAISPEASKNKTFRIVQLLLETPAMTPHQGNVATDFRSTLISKTKISDIPEKDGKLFEIQWCSAGEDEPAPGATIYKVRLKYTKELSTGELINYLNSTNIGMAFEDKQEVTQLLNIFLNHYAKSANSLATIGSSKTFSVGQDAFRGDLGAGLEVIRGFFSSVRIATARILVNVNVSHGAFFKAGPLDRLMDGYGTRNPKALEGFLKYVRVKTTHLPEKRNKAGEVIPRFKSIFRLARKDDGHGGPHPAKVSHYGAGAKDVQFWFEATDNSSSVSKGGEKGGAKGKGKGKGATPSSTAAGGKYISVFEFFKTGSYPPFLSSP